MRESGDVRCWLMTSHQRTVFLASGLLAGAVLSASPTGAEAAKDELDGAGLFLRYCASCHGTDAAGNGPVAKSLRTPPPDLRQLWKRYGTPLEVEQITQFVDGRQRVAAHGESDMPVWGRRLRQTGDPGQPAEIHIRDTLRAIVLYLDAMQARPPDASRPRDDRERPEPR